MQLSVPSPLPTTDRLTHERRTRHAVRVLTSRGWEQLLQPLAAYLGEHRLVRARSALVTPAAPAGTV